MDNTVSPGRNYTGINTTGGIITAGATAGPAFTDFTVPISVPANQIANLDSLSVSVAITDANDGNLGLTLIAPNGQSYALFVPQIIGGVTAQTRGITGANVGVNNGFAVGTTFDDSAARSIVDISPTGNRGAAAPYVGDFRPEEDGFSFPGTLDAFLKSVAANGAINGKWTLRAEDTETSTPSTPNFLNFWSLNLSTGRQVGGQVNMTPGFITSTPAAFNQYLPIVLPGSATQNFSTAAPSSPVGIGPNLVMAATTRSARSARMRGGSTPRSSATSTSRSPAVQNPTSNTDIFLKYSDDGGRSWVFAGAGQRRLSSQTDGYSESLADPNSLDQVTGRTQFQPTIAVDQLTGTVVLS